MIKQQYKAIYRSTGVPEYSGNPFIEALPPILEPRDSAMHLKTTNVVEEHDLLVSNEVRAHRIANLANSYFQPLSAHVELSKKIGVIIRSGYVGRNPRTGEHQEQLQEGYERIQSGELSGFKFESVKTTAHSMILIGFSGSGKTTSLNRILSTYPQLIYHEDLNTEQVVYLKIDCSHNGSLKELCLNFFRALDQVVGSNYERTYGLKRLGIEQMLGVMSQVARSHALGLLVIDEIQHLIKSKEGATTAMMNFFVTLVNTINIPLMLIGTHRAKSIFDAQLKSARRSAGLGAVFWDPFNPDMSEKHRLEWVGFTNNLWKQQYLRKRDLVLSEEIRDVWYQLSQGITDIVVKLFVLSQLRAITTGIERITPQLMERVYEDELKRGCK